MTAITGFGPHLMMDCRGVSFEKCSDLRYIWEFLDTLPDKVGMTKIVQPYVFPYSGLIPEDEGITGTVIIAESHITFHSFIRKDYFFFDLFSCKEFDVDFVVNEVIRAFEVEDPQIHRVDRGLYFPRNKEFYARSPVPTLVPC